jgi:hypothetical protein
MPDLVRYQFRDGPHAGEPTTERGEIERLAPACQAAACRAGLVSTVVETRFNVVRSSVPETVTTDRRLRDYLRPEARRGPVLQRADAAGVLAEAGATRGECVNALIGPASENANNCLAAICGIDAAQAELGVTSKGQCIKALRGESFA